MGTVRISLRSVWEAGQLYVALSRCRSEQDLYLDRWSEQFVLAPNKQVLAYLTRTQALAVQLEGTTNLTICRAAESVVCFNVVFKKKNGAEPCRSTETANGLLIPLC